MKILHVLRSHSWGGLELYTLELISRLLSMGVDCHLVCAPHSRVSNEAQRRKIPCSHQLLNSFYKFSADFVHVHRRQDLPMTRFLLNFFPDRKLIYSLYMSAPPKRDFYHRWIYSKISALIGSSSLLCEEVVKNFPIKKEKVKLIRYGMEHAVEFNKVYKSEGKIIFGTIARIDPGKGIRELIQSLNFLEKNELVDMELWIIGDPTIEKTNSEGKITYEKKSLTLLDEIKEMQKDSKYCNVLKWFPYQETTESYLKLMDVFILPTHHETYSLAVLEAMSFGLPVLGTNRGGTTEQIGLQMERGLLIEPKSPEKLAHAIRKYLKNKDLIKIQGERAFHWSRKNHNWTKCLSEMMEIYTTLSSNQNSPHLTDPTHSE